MRILWCVNVESNPKPDDSGASERSLRASLVMPVVCLGVAFLVVVRVASLPLSNPDTWFHLRIGHELLGPWSLNDPGSMSKFATADWVPTQWSVEVLAAAMETWFGLPGVAWLFGLLELVFVGTLYLVCRRQADALSAGLVVVVALSASSAVLSARPQIASLTFLAITVSAWLQTARDGRSRWWLVPMTWVWATAHGFWSIGVLIGIVAWLGIVVDHRLAVRGAAAVRLLGVPLASLVAACLTPVGPALLSTPFAVSERSTMIGEWSPTSFQTPTAALAAAMMAALIIIWARKGGVSWMRLFLLLLAAGLTAYSVRTVALGAVIAAPLLSAALQELSTGHPSLISRREVGALVGGVVASAGVLALLVPFTASEPGKMPDGLSREIEALPYGSVVMVDDRVGGWLEWEHPGLNPTMDGMFDAYTTNYMRAYVAAVQLHAGWQQFVYDTGAQAALLPRNDPLTAALEDVLGWRQVAQDGRWALLREGP